MEDRDLYAAINIKRFGLQQVDRLLSDSNDSESVGMTDGVKCSSCTKLVITSVRAKGATSVLHRSPETHARAV